MSARRMVLLAAFVAAFAAWPSLALTQPGALTLPPALFGGEPTVSGELFARVSMRKVKYARVLAERALVLPTAAPSGPSGATLASGATSMAAASAASASPSAPGGSRLIPLSGPDGSLAGFNEARLDYLTADPSRPGPLGLAVTLAKDGAQTVFVSDPLETVDRLAPDWADAGERDATDVARAGWTPKSIRYLVSRYLDRAPDALWRHSQDGLSTFVQRRFDKDLTDIGAIDVVHRLGQDVQVNIVAAPGPGGKGRIVLDWYAIPKRLFDLGDGRAVLRLYVGRHLREIMPGAKQVRLKELALMFFKERKEDVLRERAVEKIIFTPSGLDASLAAQGLPRDLPAKARESFSGRGELAVNLQELLGGSWASMTVTSLAVVQSSGDVGAALAATLEAARLVSVAPRRDVPAILAATAERCQSFGAACDLDAKNGFVSQVPEASLDFTALAAGRAAAQPGRDVAALSSVAASAAASASVPTRPVSSTPAPAPMDKDGAERLVPAFVESLFSSPGRLRFSSSAEGLRVESQSGGLTLEADAAFTPVPGRRYSLWLELGRERQGLSGVFAEAWGAGETARIPVKPGQPSVFERLPAKVEGVRILFDASGRELTVTLRRAVVQSADPSAKGESLFTARYLFDESAGLAVSRTHANAARLALPEGAAVPEGLIPQWLAFDAATAPWTVKDKPPVLVIEAAGLKTAVPLSASSSRVAVYLPGLFRASGLDAAKLLASASRGGLSITLEGGAPGAALDCARAQLSGQRLAAWPQVLGGEPLLTLAGGERVLAGLDAASAAAMAASAHWQSMGRADIPAGTMKAGFVMNPWLEVEALLLDAATGPALASLTRAAAPAPNGGKGPGRLLAAVAAVAVLAGAGLTLRGGRLSRAAAGAAASTGQWLDRQCGRNGSPLPARGWLLAMLGLLAAGVMSGPDALRAASMLAGALAVPAWRAARPRLARFAPSLAKTPSLHYCTGFLAALGLAAAVRAAGTAGAPVSEFLGLCGLWLFLAALASYSFTRRDPAGSDT